MREAVGPDRDVGLAGGGPLDERLRSAVEVEHGRRLRVPGRDHGVAPPVAALVVVHVPGDDGVVRVAGANPAIWGDIFSTNREAVAREIDGAAQRLREAAEVIRSGDGDRVAAWHGAARNDRRRLLEADLVGGELYELRLSVENRPGTVAEIALALGRAGVNIEDMALYPAPDMRTGAVSLWVAGEAESERAAEIVRGLGHTVSIST